MAKQFYDDYFAYVGETEAPLLYHRWTAISMVAALLGRRVHVPFGHGNIYPNMYIMLEGNPGARKGTALKPARNLLKAIDFNKLAPDRLSAERFIIEMAELNKVEKIDDMEFEKMDFTTTCEIYVMAGEFQDFVGNANLNFITLLTNLWDNLPEYKHPKIHGASVFVFEPTVNIIAAANQQSIVLSLPIEAIGQGYTSRKIFVHGEPTGRKITFPSPVDQKLKNRMCERLKAIGELHGEIKFTPGAKALLERIYKEYVPIDDFRFQHYNTRRFDHILKLCAIHTAMDNILETREDHVLMANTILHATEQRMPKALGEFGKARNSDVANAILEFLKGKTQPQNVKDIWRRVANDLNKIDDLIEILKNLEVADKIVKRKAGEKVGYMSLHRVQNDWKEELVMKDFLTIEEMA